MTTSGPNCGVFTISLDFELHWGVRDKRGLESYGENLLRVREVVPRLLSLFEKYEIHCTWATVGLLFFETVEDLKRSIPPSLPQYADSSLDQYRVIDAIGPTAQSDPFHFAPALIGAIKATPYQEIGTHTFSHYYCLEPGQTVQTFRDDLKTAIDVAACRGIHVTSLVFPRNQFSADHLTVCRDLGLTAFRGNARSWLYEARSSSEETQVRRGFRLLDNYLNLSGFQVHRCDRPSHERPVNIPASRFLRPYHPRLALLDPLRFRRIRNELTFAARHGGLYHLWWHPHNFGTYTEQNLDFLRGILDHYALMRLRHGMASFNMGELAGRHSLNGE